MRLKAISILVTLLVALGIFGNIMNRIEAHQKEEEAIRQIAINMGLNPSATSRILKLMKTSPSAIIPAEVLLNHFQEQLN